MLDNMVRLPLDKLTYSLLYSAEIYEMFRIIGTS